MICLPPCLLGVVMSLLLMIAFIILLAALVLPSVLPAAGRNKSKYEVAEIRNDGARW